MKKFFLTICIYVCAITMFAQTKEQAKPLPDKNKTILLVKASCGQCKFGLPGKDCDLAIRLNGRPYFVDGTKIDDHGDAHAKDGFCESIRKAKVQGEVKGDRFVATYFELLPEEKKKKG